MSGAATGQGRLGRLVFARPTAILAAIAAATVFFAAQIPALKMHSEFSDLLPQNHPFIQLHNEVRQTFGGANIVVLSYEAPDGEADIFTNASLARIDALTTAVDALPGVNHDLLRSLTHRTVRHTALTDLGNIVSEPYYETSGGELSTDDLAALRGKVVNDPRAFGVLVSTDLRAALVKAQFNEGEMDQRALFERVQTIRAAAEAEGYAIRAAGDPLLVGWVYSYLSQVLQVFVFTGAIMLAILIAYFRSWHGVAVPLVAVALTTVWGLGIIELLGYDLEPLSLVIPFLISARALSHGIQIVKRFELECAGDRTAPEAARRTFAAIFRPGGLGVVSDAVGLLVITLSAIPINVKLAHYASIWSLSVVPVVLVGLPVLLAVLPKPKVRAGGGGAERAFVRYGAFVTDPASAKAILAGAMVVAVLAGLSASRVRIGENEPGSPLLHRDHDYNLSAAAINADFPGSEELYLVARTDEPGGLRRPEVLQALAGLEAHMMLDAEVGGARTLPSLVRQINRLIHLDDPRWEQLPDDPDYVGGLLFTYMTSSPVSGALKVFVSPDEDEANLVFYYKDRQGTTIRRALHLARTWTADPANQVDGLTIHLAGGTIGVAAAVNEASYQTNFTVLPIVFALIFVFVAASYRSAAAGLLTLVAMGLATVVTYGYMGLAGIGINVNTVPILAVGVGIGIDYSIYVIDRIRAEAARLGDVATGVRAALATTGLAVAVTGLTLIGGVAMWFVLSDLRFQSDAALLLAVMLSVNVAAAMMVVPAVAVTWRPAFLDPARSQATPADATAPMPSESFRVPAE